LERALHKHQQTARVAVIMGVSGSGKTTVGEALARRLGWLFQEGDALHPPENIAKMKAGHPLDDEDRVPWLAAIAARIGMWRRRGERGVVTCSALKRDYREIIIGNRRDVRLGHFMPATLLDSQFAALEPPSPEEDAITVSVDAPVDDIVAQLAAALTGTGHDPQRCALTR
jgi:carbohydrate kinase (thermoresistant glucokinase family)